MSKNPQHTWNESNIVDDVEFQEKDAELFKNLLTRKEAPLLLQKPTYPLLVHS